MIVGDILGKGSHALKLLKRVCKCAEQGNVYMVAGNNDTILSEWFAGELTDEIVHWYVNSATTSIIGEMASELKMQY